MKSNGMDWRVRYFSLLCILFPIMAFADSRDDRIQEQLQEFEANPSAFMKKAPERSSSGPATPLQPRVGDTSSDYERINAEIDRLGRASGLNSSSLHRSIHMDRASLVMPFPFTSQDNAENLVDQMKYRTLEEMDSARLLEAQLEQHPWSSTYWPIAKGELAWRYADPNYPDTYDWKTNSDFILDAQDTCSIDQLSPAEKYDLLAGDSKNTLTHAMLNEGQRFYSTYGTVDSWMGICHGWAPASYMDPRPATAIEVLAADGQTKIRFFPSDVKALSSLLWANGRFENRFIGLRCENPNPPTDENGRVTDPACYGENPGTWHLAVVNQLGVSRRSLVMDAMHDTEIWNQPIYSYRYSYFNPRTKQPTDSLAEATVAISSFSNDQFKRYRSDQAHSVVGIAMDLTYVSETMPSTAQTDSPGQDALVTVHYLYDLEIGNDNNVVGGEWYSNAHPGFLWTPTPNARAVSTGDDRLSESDPQGSWDGSSALPVSWLTSIISSSAQGQPVARIVDTLEGLAALQQ